MAVSYTHLDVYKRQILVMAPIAIAAMMEHIGDVSAISSTTGKNFIEDPGLHRTLLRCV